MFTGNETTATKRNPGTGLLTLLGLTALAYGAYKIFFAPKPTPAMSCPEGQVWSEAAGKCIPKLEPEPDGRSTTIVEDSVKGTRYTVPYPGSGGAGRSTRKEVGLEGLSPELKENDYASFITTWDGGAEVMWGRAKTRTNDTYGLEVVGQVPYGGAIQDARPAQLANHQISVGSGHVVPSSEIVDIVIL